MHDIDYVSKETLRNLDTILDELGITYTKYHNRIAMPCPIHDGSDNPNAVSIFNTGIWKCFTHACHENYGSTIIGFIQGVLSKINSTRFTRHKTIHWLCNQLNIQPEEPVTHISKEKTNFIHLHSYISNDRTYHSSFVPRSMVQQRLPTPAPPNLVNLHLFSQDILRQYDVGFCNMPGKSMYQRIVVPLYDDLGEYALGFIGRSIFDKCDICNHYHDSKTRCPMSKEEKKNAVKWKISHRFNADLYLYNYWIASNYIKQDGYIILTEGTGDIWKLAEANIHNGLALLGTKFTDAQLEKLEQTGAHSIILALDGDEAGQKAQNSIKRTCQRLFNIYTLQLEDDIGSMSVSDVHKVFDPVIASISSKCYI